MQTLGGSASAGNRESKCRHLEIDASLTVLDRELGKMRDFISELSDGPCPTGSTDKALENSPPFLSVYNGIAERVDLASKKISEITAQLREMLL